MIIGSDGTHGVVTNRYKTDTLANHLAKQSCRGEY